QTGDTSTKLDYVATNSLTLNGATIRDATGNNAVLTLATPGMAGSLGANKAIVISAPAIPPAVLNVTSAKANGNYTVGENIDITVQFSQTVWVSGIPKLTLETGTIDYNADYTGGSGTATLTFRYTVQAGDTSSDLDYATGTSLILSGGNIRDIASNDAVLTLPAPGTAGSLGANKNIVIDTTAPTTPGSVIDGVACASTTSSPNITWTASTDTGGSGITRYEVAIGTTAGGNQTLNWTSVGVVTNATMTGLVLTNGTKYYASVRAVDNASNVSTVGQGDGWWVDTTAPTQPGSVDDGVASTSTTSSPNITWTASTDGASGINRYDVAIGTTAGGTQIKYWTSVGNVTNATMTGLVLTNGTKYYASVRAVDNASNASTVGQGDGWWVDTTAPNVTLSAPSQDPVNGVFTVTVTFNEVVTGFDASDIIVGNGTKGTLANTTPGMIWTIPITPVTSGTNVTVNVAASAANDIAGNGNTVATQLTRGYTASGGSPNPCSFSYTGANQTYIVPAGCTSISVKAWGAAGGAGSVYSGGGGGYVDGVISVTPGETLIARVGGGGSGTGSGGFPNGGSGASNGGAGGGSSSILRSSTVLIEAGGGGGGSINQSGWGGGTVGPAGNGPGNGIGQSAVANTGAGGGGYSGGSNGGSYGMSGHGGTTYCPDGGKEMVFWGPSCANSSDPDHPAGIGDAGSTNGGNGFIKIWTGDIMPPNMALSGPSTTDGGFWLTITFNEIVTGFTDTDVNVVNGTKDSLTVWTPGKMWQTYITPTSPGLVTVNIPAGAAKDLANNDSVAATFTCTYQPRVTFDYPGNDGDDNIQTFHVPSGCHSIFVKMWGAGAGGGYDSFGDQPYDPNTNSSRHCGGGGGYVEATIDVTPGEDLTIKVGEGGHDAVYTYDNNGGYGDCNGGWPNGGDGYFTGGDEYDSGGGGGGTSIWRGDTLLIAAGGGGGGTPDGCGAGGGDSWGQDFCADEYGEGSVDSTYGGGGGGYYGGHSWSGGAQSGADGGFDSDENGDSNKPANYGDDDYPDSDNLSDIDLEINGHDRHERDRGDPNNISATGEGGLFLNGGNGFAVIYINP
ncbi:MAG: fibronectin type III domain-containing protein, partial [Candidatus Riflebacteria bacterium]|nr:fibronectin type III domain-containing protein [Candidatus Riflebacteria bacterium]